MIQNNMILKSTNRRKGENNGIFQNTLQKQKISNTTWQK